MLRFLTAGESHGPALTAIVEGMIAGVPITPEYINNQLARRQGGYGRGGRMKIEQDKAQLLSGIRGGYSTGSPITLQIENRDWSNWAEIMAPGPEAKLTERVVTRPRPGHADLAGALKYNQADIRNILERSSARETAARVAVGTLARRMLEELGITILGFVRRVGSVEASIDERLTSAELSSCAQQSQLLCPDHQAEQAMIREIDMAREAGDSLGGVFEIRAYGLPTGVGSHVQWDRKLDSRLAGAVMGIQAIKGVEIGLGFAAAEKPGSQVHDEIFYTVDNGFYRTTNGAGGIEGGISNGEPIIIKAAMKPIPTLYKPLRSVDLASKEPFEASIERSDVCAVPAACVVGEAVVAWELANAMLEKFGGDSLRETKDRVDQWRQWIVDTDFAIEEVTGLTVEQIFAKHGVKRFRGEEALLVSKLADKENLVIATGGGLVMDHHNVEKLRANGVLICLQAAAETICKRVKNKRTRPLLTKGNLREKVHRLLEERKLAYAAAEFVVNTDHYEPEQIVNIIFQYLQERGILHADH